jgi:hypothetical protein
VAAVITNNRSEADKLEQRQEVLKAYTGQVRALLAKVDEVVSSMSAAGLGDEAARADLATEAPKWQKDLEAAGVEASAIQPIEGLDVSTRVLFQSLQLYSTAAKTFALVPDVEGKARDDLLQRAAEVSSQAGTLWGTAVSILDSELAEAELDPSGIPVPGTSAPPPPVNPTPSPSPQATIETKGNVDRGKDKKDKRRGNDDGGD